jgi:hypothetical protein
MAQSTTRSVQLTLSLPNAGTTIIALAGVSIHTTNSNGTFEFDGDLNLPEKGVFTIESSVVAHTDWKYSLKVGGKEFKGDGTTKPDQFQNGKWHYKSDTLDWSAAPAANSGETA